MHVLAFQNLRDGQSFAGVKIQNFLEQLRGLFAYSTEFEDTLLVQFHDLVIVIAIKQGIPRQPALTNNLHFIEDDPQTEHIDRCAQPLLILQLKHFRSRIPWCPTLPNQIISLQQRSRQSKVSYHQMPIVLEENIAGFQIPVDDLLVMNVLHPFQHLPEDGLHFLLFHPVLLFHLHHQISPLHQLQNSVVSRVLLIDLDQLQHIPMLTSPHQHNLIQQTLLPILILLQPSLREHLRRILLPRHLMLDQIHRREPPFPHLLNGLVLGEEI